MNSDPFEGVVTAATVYGKVAEVGDKVTAVDHKIDRVDDKVTGVITRLDDHENRIRAVEADRWPHGKITLLIAAAGLLVALLGLILKGG